MKHNPRVGAQYLQLDTYAAYNNYFGDVDEFDDDLCPLLRGAATKNHALNPLGQPVEQVDGPLESRVVGQRARHGVLLVILKLHNKRLNEQQITKLSRNYYRNYFPNLNRSELNELCNN